MGPAMRPKTEDRGPPAADSDVPGRAGRVNGIPVEFHVPVHTLLFTKEMAPGRGSGEHSHHPGGTALTLAWRSVIGAGCAFPRDAGPHRENWPEVGGPSPARRAVWVVKAS